MRLSFAFLVAFMLSSSANAEIEKIAIPVEQDMSFYLWPKLQALDGWHQDREHSFYYRANVLAPDGYTFKNAESVIYAGALYKPRIPNLNSLDALIDNDKREFELSAPGGAIREVAPISTADGERLRSFVFYPVSGGNWERVSYGEEGEYYLVFTVSSRSMSGLTAAIPAYEKLIVGYRK